MYYYWKEAKNRFCIAMYINNILPMGMISNSLVINICVQSYII